MVTRKPEHLRGQNHPGTFLLLFLLGTTGYSPIVDTDSLPLWLNLVLDPGPNGTAVTTVQGIFVVEAEERGAANAWGIARTGGSGRPRDAP